MNIPLGEWSGSDATKELHKTVKENQGRDSKRTDVLILLTAIILVLTIVLVVRG